MDKILKKHIFISLIFIISFSCATTIGIDEQIEAIKNAPESKRVELMNQFKRQLILMNQTERASAIAQLKSDKEMDSPPPSSPDNIIDRVQSSSIEQSIQINRDIAVHQEIQESIKIPHTPKTPTPPISQPQDMPNTSTPVSPSTETPESPVEQQQEMPDSQTPPSTETPQEIPDPQTVPVEQPQGTPTSTPATPSTGRPQVTPHNPTSNSGGI